MKAVSPTVQRRDVPLDAEAFHHLAEIHRPAVQAHCYRMLGSLHDAEDAVQETLLRAWRGRRTFGGRASLRTWLYRVATNVCLDALRQRSRRILPLAFTGPADPGDDVLADVREPIWLEPCPTAGLHDFSSDPAARYELRESLSLAFAAALQDLAPRQRAALLLRDVLGWSTAETAKALRTTVQAVNSALQRARQAVKTRRLDGGRVLRELPRTHHELIDRFLQAWEAGDAGALARLLTEDATMTMPPSPSWYAGRQAVAGFFAQRVFQGPLAGRLYPVPAEANFLPALAIYRDDETAGRREAFAIIVLVLRGEQVAWMAGFADASLFCPFGLPLVMPRTGGPPGRAQASAPTPQDSPPPTRG